VESEESLKERASFTPERGNPDRKGKKFLEKEKLWSEQGRGPLGTISRATTFKEGKGEGNLKREKLLLHCEGLSRNTQSE